MTETPIVVEFETPLFLEFETQRLTVVHWDETVNDAVLRRALVEDLADILTPPVLENLPPSMMIDTGDNAIEDWISARLAECDVYLVTRQSDDRLIGLLILVCDLAPDGAFKLYFGYLFAEQHWGQGYASELIKGLVCKAQSGPNCTLSGGVALNNPASARVLIKAGFARDAAQSTGDTDVFTLQAGKHA